MATTLPAKLRNGDILRYTQRAAQLEKVKPAIAYWCYYWVVNQILAKNLHQTDEECMNYTTELVDKLEQFKSQYPTDDSINDDVAGQASVEQFGLETFKRADNAVRANKASKQTAETFQAAATFLELVQIWSPPSADIAAKIKYAKYHALRIARALKAGEDPNLSNPPPESRPEDEVTLDPNDPDVKMINAAADYTHGGAPGGGVKETGLEGMQPSVEEVPDEHDFVQRRLARQSSIDQSLHPSRASSQPRPPPPNIARPADEIPPAPDSAQSATAPLATPQNPRQNSLGGGYFPEVDIPSAPQGPPGQGFDAPPRSPDISIPSPSTLQGDPQDMATEYYINAPTGAAMPSLGGIGHDEDLPPPPSLLSPSLQSQPQPPTFPPHAQPQPQSRAQPPTYPPQQPQPQPPRQHYGPPQLQPSAPPPPAQQQQQRQETYNTDDEAVMRAQKHARFAISALNFEDVPTAVKELRAALRTLGAV